MLKLSEATPALPDTSIIPPGCCSDFIQVGSPVLLATVGVLMILDILSGLVKAFATKTVDSSKMRQGMWHKASSMLTIALAVVLDTALAHGFNLTINPVFEAVTGYIIIMEALSILENVEEANPEMGSLVSRFKASINGKNLNKEDEDV